MASTDTATLNVLGNDIVTWTVSLAIETVLMTLYSMLTIKSAFILLEVRRTGGAGKVFAMNAAIISLMYLIGLTLWIIGLVELVAETRTTLIDHPDLSLSTSYEMASQFNARRTAILDVLYAYMTFLGDSVIVWRVYAFWASSSHWRLAVFLPVALLITSLASSMTLTYCVAHFPGDIVNSSFQHPVFCRNMQTVSYAAPAATTAATTVLIGIKVWSHTRQLNKLGIGSGSRPASERSRIEDVTILLVESGLAYFVFFLSQVILTIPSVGTAIAARRDMSFATTVFSHQTSSIVGIYPTAIICLVHSKRSIVDTMTNSTLRFGPAAQSVSLGQTRSIEPQTDKEMRGEHVIGFGGHSSELDNDHSHGNSEEYV
ncbi:hypothetical protein VKT23_017061 [Stygiomarasmius scandens]|uniref:Integral membrane protein n=1 Tax=Marasmiellus scandens TaxID=2682957 RepID=A0ABR1IW56_9AGAR